jgi:hypothetical protein
MRDETLHKLTSIALVVGALLGMAGSFAPTAGLRGLAWGTDGVALIVGSALLAVHYLRRGDAPLAAGFLVFLVGETLIVSGSAVDLAASAPSFAAGAALWSASLGLISASPVMPRLIRGTGAIAAVLFAITAALIFSGGELNPLSRPLPFFGYPFLAATLIGWAWHHRRATRVPNVLEVAPRRPPRSAPSSETSPIPSPAFQRAHRWERSRS